MINTQSFVLYESVYKHIQTLSNRVSETTALHYINCIMEFGLYGVEPPDDDEVWIYGFEQAMTSIYSAKERYNKSKENGRKGGAPERFSVDQVVELKEQGLTNKEVANILGCSPKTVERKIKAYREAQQQTDKTEHNLKEKEREKNKDSEKKNHTTNVNDTYNITKNTTENECTNDDKKYKDNVFSDLI